jgi:peptide-methionine (S)-S-oxide reductase
MTTERTVLAGGCFWGMQDLIRKQPGVISTRVGYTGGKVKNATYRNHDGHAEAIEIIFDPAKTSYRTLLEFFFGIHDPTTLNRQGNDWGTSYRSAIFYTSDEQRKLAEDTIADVDASHLWPGKVVTEVTPAGDFWEAEPEHQDSTTDDIAERVRKIGGTTLRSIGHINRLKRIFDNDADYVTRLDMLAELREDNKRLTVHMRELHGLCDEHGDVATASLLENWIDESERRT